MFISSSPKETQSFAASLAQKIVKALQERDRALVICLRGELGAGKTTFVQGFARGLGVTRSINSPTFLLVRQYPLPSSLPFSTLYHIDAYRIANVKDVATLGLAEVFDNVRNIVLIEWPENIASHIPSDAMMVEMGHGERENQRIIYF